MISSVGFPNPLFFMGIVEEVASQTGIPGRIRVRAFGIHPPAHVPDGVGSELDDVPTDALPWAPVINGSGGAISKMPEVSEWVFGFFLDGREAQHPFVLGTIPGVKGSMPALAGTQYDSPYEIPTNSAVNYFGQAMGGMAPEWAGMQTDPEITSISSKSPIEAQTGDDAYFEELDPVSGGTPDSLSVVRGKTGGSNVQVGGDGSSEHIALIHESGSHVQIDAHGNVKVGSQETIQHWSGGNIQNRAAGSYDISSGEGVSIRVDGGKFTLYVNGDVDVVSRGDMNFTSSGAINLNAAEDVNIKGSRIAAHAHTDNIDLVATDKFKINAGGRLSLAAGEEAFIESGSDFNLLAESSVKISSDGKIGLKGTEVNLDDNVNLASGLAEDAEEGDDAGVPSQEILPDPAGRVINRVGSRSSYGGRGYSNSSSIDDTDSQIPLDDRTLNGEGFQKGLSLTCRLVKEGYSKAAAAGIAGNAMVESDEFRADTEYGGGGGRGWLQWTGPRRDTFERWASSNNLHPTSDAANYNFMIHELEGNTGNQWTGGGNTNQYKLLDNPEQAAEYFMRNFERPRLSTAKLSRRQAYARSFFDTECPVEDSIMV